MKKVIIVLVITALWSASAFAETRYVSDRLEITVRAGAGNEYRIIRMLNSGQRVEIVEPGDDWSRVRIPGGQEGWTLTRFLQSDPPARQTVQTLTARLEPLELENTSLKQENERLIRMNQEIEGQLKEVVTQHETSVAAHEKLREESSEFLEMKEEHKQFLSDIEEKNLRIEELEGRVTEQFFSKAISWFLAGAGVLLLGMLLGSRSKKKRPGLR